MMILTVSSCPRSSSGFNFAARLSCFIALTKPRVMTLAVFTAFVGMMVAPSRLDFPHGIVAIIAIAMGAGAAGALNMWYDADIDSVMDRTAGRPIPCGAISPSGALAFGLVLSFLSVGILAVAINFEAARLLALTIFFYAVVYTIWLKRSTPHNIVIGGVSGALPPLIGWAAATGGIAFEPFILFLIIFLWTPPHFWALSLNRTSDYARAGLPMLPVVAGRAETARQILLYSGLLSFASLLPWAFGFAGAIYGVAAAVLGATFIALAMILVKSDGSDRRPAYRLFAFSITYLFVLFTALLVDKAVGDRLSLPHRLVSLHDLYPSKAAFARPSIYIRAHLAQREPEEN